LDVDVKWVLQQLRETRRTQTELARYLGLEPPQMNKTLKGRRRIQDREADLIREFFRVAGPSFPQPEKLRLTYSPGMFKSEQAEEIGAGISVPLRSEMVRSLPIYGSVTAGGRRITMDKPVDYARRPRRLDDREDVFALYVDDYQMEPVIEPGKLVLLESLRPPAPGDNVVVQIKAETPDGEDQTVIKRLVATDGDSIRLAQHNPPKEFVFPLESVERIWRVMTIHDLLVG